MVESSTDRTDGAAQMAIQSPKGRGSDVFKQLYERHRRTKPLGEAPTHLESILATLPYLDKLLIFITLAWFFHFRGSEDDTIIFITSFLAIIHLSKLLSFAIGELAKRVGETLAGLIHTTLGNTVELALALIALFRCNLKIAQLSLLGSILYKLLLIPGMCFFAGGIRFSEQGLGTRATQINSSLLMLIMTALLLPAAFRIAPRPGAPGLNNARPDPQEAHDILTISRIVAVILLLVYLCYLVFQLFSHKNLYDDCNARVQKSVEYIHTNSQQPHYYDHTERDLEAGSMETEDEPQMSLPVTITLLTVITVVLGITTEFLVESIDGLTTSELINEEFVALVLLPMLGNSEEVAIASKESTEDKLALIHAIALGSSIQIAAFIFPLVVTLAWVLGKPLTLLSDPFVSIILFLSVFIVTSVVQDGKSNWLKGMILMTLYSISAIMVWYYPGSDPFGLLANCA